MFICEFIKQENFRSHELFLHYKEINIEDEILNQLNNLANELTKKNIPSEFLEEIKSI